MADVRFVRLVVAFLALGVASIGSAQTPDQMPPMPKPGPAHEALKMDAGTWNAVVEFSPGPGAPTMTSKGVEENTMGCGGLCLISHFKGEAMGAPFEGHGMMTWDSAKNRYVGTWTDSMSTGLAHTEGTYDKAAKKWTGWMQGTDPTGKAMKQRFVSEWKDPNTRVFTTYMSGPDGKEMQTMKIVYTKK